MSKRNLTEEWNENQAAAAAAEGWRLVLTFENEVGAAAHWEIASMWDGDQIRSSDRKAGEFVVSRARLSTGALHRQALTLVMQR